MSASSCYRVLKPLGWVFQQEFRQAPWKVSPHEPFRSNQLWGDDWSILSTGGHRYCLSAISDYFSRYIVAWGTAKTVTQREVQNLLAFACLSEGIGQQNPKPIVRADRGSPDMARQIKRLILDLEIVLSPRRAYRSTDNLWQERWYRTVKQEEMARSSIWKYIRWNHDEGPHQALRNYTRGFLHGLGNKTDLLLHHRRMVRIVEEQRINLNRMGSKYQPMAVSD